jgi:WD40 repeat protein
VYYVNIAEQFHSLLVGAPSSPVIFTRVVGGYLLTSHQNARLKLWNLETAEELKTYKWRYACTEAYFDESLGKLVCFCANQTVKLVNLKKFTKEETYLPEDGKIDGKIDDFVVGSAMVGFGGRPMRWNFYSKGNVFTFEITQEGKKKIIKGDKVLELGFKVTEVVVNPEKNLIIACASTGSIFCYNVDYQQ